MMTEKKLIPELRFPGFEGEWGNKVLDKLGEFLGGGTPSSSTKEYWTGQIPWISSSDILENDITNINITRFITEEAISESATKLIPENSILIVSRVGIGKFAVSPSVLCTSQDFTNFIVKKADPYFICYCFLSKKAIFKRISQGTSIKGFTSADLRILRIPIPNSQEEQQKIASFLSTVDERIQLLQKKKDALANYKKSVMQKIFNREIRFKDDNGKGYPDWEEKRLGDVGYFIGGGTPTSSESKFWEGNIPWISSSDLVEDNIHTIKITRFINEDAIKNSATKIIPSNSILIVSRVGIGKFAVSKDDLCTSQDFTNFIPEGIDSYYLTYYFSYKKTLFNRLSQGTSIKGFTGTDLRSLKIMVSPSKREQQKIATFLSAIDESIEQLTHQIAYAKSYKKGLLQKMFV